MNTRIHLIAAALLIVLPAAAFAQADAHHPEAALGAAAPPVAVTPSPTPTTGGPPQQAANMMPMMQMQSMPMMQMQMMQMHLQMMQMMQMMQSQQAMAQGAMSMPAGTAMSEAGRAYMDAMTMMERPMMEALRISDPDIAFVTAMIPHHQGAIDMAKAVLQYGTDETVKEWANQIIAAQEAEITQMQEWLRQRSN